MTDYVTVAEVLAMHADQIERYGGSHGLRDPWLLEAALYRPQTGLSQNHAFIDGNKRTAFVASFDRLVPWLRAHVTM